MTSPREISLVQRINAFGVVFVFIFLVFVISNGVASMLNTQYVYNEEAFETAQDKGEYVAYIPLVGSQYMPLMGILGGGFYFHNMSLSMVHNAEKPEHNTRNILFGYLLVFLTYSVIGVTGVYGFTGVAFAEYAPSVDSIKENCLNMMSSDNKVATFIRSCILCQLLCVNTLLFGLLRGQIVLLYRGVTQGIESVRS